MSILLQTTQKSVKSYQTVPKTLTVVYTICYFLQAEFRQEKDTEKKCEFQTIDA